MQTTSLSESQREKDKISGRELSPFYYHYSLSRHVHNIINQGPTKIILAEVEKAISEWFYPLQAIINIDFQDLLEAFVHKSMRAQYPDLFSKDYERLEILGDTVLNLLITEKIINLHPQFNEGQISKFRASLVNTTELRQIGLALKLNDFVLVGKSELETKEEHQSILADCFESILAVIYLKTQRNLSACHLFLDYCLAQYKLTFRENFFDLKKLIQFDAKTRLQEWAMAELKTLPEYRSSMIQERPYVLFLTELYFNNQKISEAIASSKKKGQMKLAADYLNILEDEKKTNFADHSEKGDPC